MARKTYPKLGQSMRFYVENTLRARIRQPAVERYRPEAHRRRARWIGAVLLLVGAAVAAAWYAWF